MKRLLFTLLSALLLLCCPGACADGMELRYADQFTVEYESDGCALVTIGGEDRFLIVPEGVEPPDAAGAVTLRLPLRAVYAASSAAADHFSCLGALDCLRLTGTRREDWSLPELRRAMDEGRILYAGKYGAPDYELLLAEGADLAVENTMIYHSPETKEQLEALGIPVLVERSSYEAHPLGRLEWIKLYGLLTGRTEEAAAFFDAQAALAEEVSARGSCGRTTAFFYITANGGVNVRRPEDYLAKMISLAGGEYALSSLITDDGSARSTMNMQAESFYAAARDADVLIYNATVDGGMDSLRELLAKGEWLADFKAVQSGDVWCTEADVFQQSSGIAAMIAELHQIFSGTAPEAGLRYFHRLR